MPKKLPLVERVDFLRGSITRERDRLANSTTQSNVFRGYVVAMNEVLPLLRNVLKRNDVVEILRELSERIDMQARYCDFGIETPDEDEVYERAIHTQYKRLFYQVDNLLKELPKDKEYGDR